MRAEITCDAFIEMFRGYEPKNGRRPERSFCQQSLGIIFECLKDKEWQKEVVLAEVYAEFRIYSTYELVDAFLGVPKDEDNGYTWYTLKKAIRRVRAHASIWELEENSDYLVRNYSHGELSEEKIALLTPVAKEEVLEDMAEEGKLCISE